MISLFLLFFSLFSCSFSISQGDYCLILGSPENRACVKSLHANTSLGLWNNRNQVEGKSEAGREESKGKRLYS